MTIKQHVYLALGAATLIQMQVKPRLQGRRNPFRWNAPDPGQGDAHPGRPNLDYAGN